MAKALSRKVTIYINGREVESTLKSLEGELAKLRTQQRNATIGSEEYIRTSLKIKELNSVINEQKKAVQGLGDSWKETRTKLADYSNMIMGVQSIFQMVDLGVGKMKDLAKDAAALDDVYADVMKTTSLTHEQVEELNEAFKKMDTRTSREQLNQLAYEAGKLGINSEEAVAQFVSASDKINIALGDVLGEGAMVTVGKLTNIYEGVSKTLEGKNLEEKMLAIGSAVNSLGQASTANEGYMVEFMKRLGGIAAQAGMSADQVLGYASALDQNGQAVEMSATAFMKLIQQMVKKPEEFVQAAGVSIEEFRRMMDEDMNGAVLRTLEGMERGGGFQQLIGMFADMGLDGARAATVVSSLAKHLDQVREAQELANREMQTGSSVINEFNTKNETMQAQAEKAKKRFEEVRIELGNELYPVLIHLQKSGTVLMKGFAGWVQALKKQPTLLIPIIAALLTLNRTRLLGLATNNKLISAFKKLTGFRAAENIATVLQAKKEKKLVYEKELARLQSLKTALAEEQEVFLKKKYNTTSKAQQLEIYAANKAKKLNEEITKQSIVVENAHTASLRASKAAWAAMPWGAIIAGLTSLVPLVVKLYKNSEIGRLNRAVKEAGRIATEEQGKIRVLRDRMVENAEGTREYAEALEELKQMYPEVMAKHIDEKGHLIDLAKAYEDLSKAAKQSARDRVYAEKTEEAYADLAEVVGDSMKKIQSHLRANHGVNISEAEWDEVFRRINDEVGKVSDGTEDWKQALENIKKIYDEFGIHGVHYSLFGDPSNSSIDIIKALKDVQEQYESTEHIIERYGVKLEQGKKAEDETTYSVLENAKKRKSAIESEIAVLNKRMEILSRRIDNGYDGQVQYEKMKNQLYDLEASARGVASEITNLEKALSGMSVEQMKARKNAVQQEILTLQSKLHVMESVFYVDLLSKQQLESDKAKLEQLNREWLFLLQEIKKAEDVASKAAGAGSSTRDGKETPAQRKAREKREREEKAWNSFSQNYEQVMAKITARTLTGVEKINAEVDASIMKMRQELENVDKAVHPEAAENLERLVEQAERWKAARIDEYLTKTQAEIDKLRKSTAKQGNGEQVDKAAKAVEELRQKISGIDDELMKLYADQAALFPMTDKASRRQLHDVNERIAAYRELRNVIAASVFASIDTSVKNPFEKAIDQDEDKSNFNFTKAREKAMAEVAKQVEEYTKKLDDAIAAEELMEKAARESGDADEAERHRKNAEALREQKAELDEVAEGEQTVKEKAEELAKSKAFRSTLQNWADAVDEFGSKALSVFSNINTLLKNIADSRLQQLEKEKDAEIETLDEQLEQNLISQEEYESRKKELEDNYKDKADEAALEAWRREKSLAAAEATIAAAVATMKIWAGEGTTAYKVAMTALMAAEFAAQLEAIKNEPEPYAKGGYVPKRTVYQAGEAGPEWVASYSLLTDPVAAPIIEQLEAYQRGNRRALADIPMAQLNMPVATRAARELGRRRSLSEGRLSEALPAINPNVSVTMPWNDEMIQLWRELASYLKDPKNRQAVISRQRMEDFEKQEQFLLNRARLQ